MNGDNLPYQSLTVVPFTAITSEWGNGIGDDILSLAAGTGLDDSSITTDKIDDGAVTNAKLTIGAQNVITSNVGTTTSTSYTATLSGTPGTNPSVTVSVGSSKQVLITLGGAAANSGSGACYISVNISGSNTVAGSDVNAFQMSGSSGFKGSFADVITLANSGSTTFTLNYRVSGGTGTFLNRHLSVVPL